MTKPEYVQNPDAALSEWRVNWKQAPHDGYTLDADGNPIKPKIVPKPGDVFDRYGDSKGVYVAPVEDGMSAPYASRSMPYDENPNALRQYRVVRDFAELPDAVRNLPEGQFKSDIMYDINKHWDGNPSQMTAYTGTAAPAFGSTTGGAPQTQLPLTCEALMRMGFLVEITPTPFNPSLFSSSGLGTWGGTKIDEE